MRWVIIIDVEWGRRNATSYSTGGDVAMRRRTQRVGVSRCDVVLNGEHAKGSVRGLELEVDVAELVPGKSLLVEDVEEWIRVEVFHVPHTRLAP